MKKQKPVTFRRYIKLHMREAIGLACVTIACITFGVFAAQAIIEQNGTDRRTETSAPIHSLDVSTSIDSSATPGDVTISTTDSTSTNTADSTAGTTAATTTGTTTAPTTKPTTSPTTKPTTEPTTTTTTTTTAATSTKQTDSDYIAPDLTGYVVVLDPGHQSHANYDQESIGPDMEGTKAKCSSGTTGVSTYRAEYEVNLEIGLNMRDYLQSLGCTVYMTRTTNDVDISNIERANIALSYAPDVYLRLHCNGSSDSSARGISVFVADTGSLIDSLKGWGNTLGSCLSDATGFKFRGTSASSVYSGLNWARDIPSFLLEMGFMTNATEDKLLSDPDFQQLICEGAATFISTMPQS